MRAVSGETHSRVIAWDRYFDSDRDGETLLCVFHAGSERSGPTRVCTGFAPGTDLRVLHGEDDISMFAAGVRRTDEEGCIVVDVPPQVGFVLGAARRP